MRSDEGWSEATARSYLLTNLLLASFLILIAAWYARDLILERISLPNRETMDAEWKVCRAAEEAIEATDEANIRYQATYTERLQGFTDYPTFNIEGVVQCFLEWEVRTVPYYFRSE